MKQVSFAYDRAIKFLIKCCFRFSCSSFDTFYNKSIGIKLNKPDGLFDRCSAFNKATRRSILIDIIPSPWKELDVARILERRVGRAVFCRLRFYSRVFYQCFTTTRLGVRNVRARAHIRSILCVLGDKADEIFMCKCLNKQSSNCVYVCVSKLYQP